MLPEFLCGPLADPDVTAVVLGCVGGEPAELPGHRVAWPAAGCAAGPVPDPGSRAPGLLVADPGAAGRQRLEFWGAVMGLAPGVAVCEARGGPARARIWVPEGSEDATGAAPADTPVCIAVAREVMAQFGRAPAAEVAHRRAMLEARAASRLRAAALPPPAPGGGFTSQAVRTLKAERPWDGFFAVETRRLTHPLFGGGVSPPVERAGFVMADAVTVLPYDPGRDRVLAIEQFRFGPFLRGDPRPWTLEPVAGRIDLGETPQETARREAREEAGVEIGALHAVAEYYPTPGAISEYLYSFVGIAELPDGANGVHGLAQEHEDIRGHLLDLEGLERLAASGGLRTGPMLLTALWLLQNRDRLRHAGA